MPLPFDFYLVDYNTCIEFQGEQHYSLVYNFFGNHTKEESIKKLKDIQNRDKIKKDYIEKARQAALINNKQTYNLAKQGLKLCLSKQRFLDSMVANFEIALQMNEMNKVINGFVSGMNLIADEMKGVTSTIDIAKAQAAYEKALASNQGQYEALDAFLREAEGSIESFAGNENDVSEDELDMLINNEACDSEDSLDKEIDEKIANVRQKMKV